MDETNGSRGAAAAASELIPEKLQHFLSSVGIVNLPSSSPDLQVAATARNTSLGSASLLWPSGAAPVDDDNEEEDIFESAFDLSQERLRHFFHMFDTDKDGRISYDSLKQGLQYHVTGVDDQSFQVLVDYLDLDQSGDIDFEEFAQGIRLMMLRALFHVDDSVASRMLVMDYDSNRLERMLVNEEVSSQPPVIPPPKSFRSAPPPTTDESTPTTTTASPNSLYLQPRASWINVRWINVLPNSATDAALTMKRLAVKFALHPLALEDALAPQLHRPKVEAFSNHYLIMVPIMTMDAAPRIVSEFHETVSSGYVRRFWGMVTCCCTSRRNRSGNNHQESATTTAFVLKRPAHAPKIHVHTCSIFVLVPENDTVITLNEPNATHPWKRVERELEKRYSKLRQYDAQYLVYALLDHSVDLLRPITKAFRKDLELEVQYLHQVRFRDSLEQVHSFRKELERIVRKLKAFLRLLVHVIEDPAISPGATLYLKDVLDNLENEEEELRRLIDECHSLDAMADKYQSRQMDQTLYTLTVISSVFLPAQFLTGVWGMNFENMPELDEQWAYPMFWGITVFMSLVLLIALNFGRLRR